MKKVLLKLISPPIILVGFAPFIIGQLILQYNETKCDLLVESRSRVMRREEVLASGLSEEQEQEILRQQENELASIDNSLEEHCYSSIEQIIGVGLMLLGFILAYNGFMLDLKKITSESIVKEES